MCKVTIAEMGEIYGQCCSEPQCKQRDYTTGESKRRKGMEYTGRVCVSPFVKAYTVFSTSITLAHFLTFSVSNDN